MDHHERRDATNDTLNTEPRELTDLELDAVAGGDLTKLGESIVQTILEAALPVCGWLVCDR